MNFFRDMSRKRMIILGVSAIILVVIIIGAAAGTTAHKKSKGGNEEKSPQTSSAQSIKAMCSVTEHPDSCFTSISSMEASNSTVDPGMLFQASLVVARDSLEKLSVLPEIWMNQTSDPGLRSALEVCDTMVQDAIDATNDSISTFHDTSDPLSSTGINNLKTWLSTSLTDLETCLDALVEVNATTLDEVKTAMKNSTEFASNSLAIVTKFLGFVDKFKGRKLLGSDQELDFPTWLHPADRRLLQAGSPEKPDLTVAKDGTGDFTTITAALSKIPKKNKARFVIYVKAGVYREQVTLDKTMQNVMMYGDGMTKSIVVFNINYVDGQTSTMLTASFAAAGKGFIAKNMGFKNDAGAIKHQAVALRSASDQSVFYQCSFDAFQDTLYAHNGRQFYSGCEITGTVDFIFGNAAVVFQNCNIRPRQPMPSQFITVTAQGKKDPNQNTGTTVQNCNISPLDDVTVPVYLGRPWKSYSTTIFIQSYIDGFLRPEGWSEWDKGVTPPSTIFYAESQNTGPGADVSGRVTWDGYRPSLSSSLANKFTVGPFLDGHSWIAAANVQFT